MGPAHFDSESNWAKESRWVGTARFDPRQIGPGLIWHGSNWVIKESEYGLDHKTMTMSMSCILLCNSLALREGPEGVGVRIPVPSIEIIQNPSPNMKKGKIPSLEAVVP